MAETSVRYQRRGKTVELPIRFLGPDQNFVLKTEPISHRLSSNIPPRLLDLLEIASAVFCADSSVSRGALTQPRHGESWRRELDFTFAVRDTAFWKKSDNTRLLRDSVEFMTDDQISCQFVQAEAFPQIQSYMDFNQDNGDSYQIDDVILFSGGLDSLTGTLDTLAKSDRRVALVTHRSAPKTMYHQNKLIEALKRQFGDRLLWIPVLVHRKGQRSSESTQRSRSLLFSALGAVVAHMLQADRIQFFENGIVSQNLPVARPIAGTLATRTTHPRTLNLLEELLSQVADAPLAVKNPFELMTKTEVVGRLKESGLKDLLPLTVSCNHTFKRKSKVRHCGSCTQCLDRRFAVLANGIGDLEDPDDYDTDVLFGARTREDEAALVIEWVRHARRLADMDPMQFQKRFIGDLLRMRRAFGDQQNTIHLCQQMHNRHGQAVQDVLKSLSDDEVSRAPDGSIAAMLGRSPSPPARASLPVDVAAPKDRPAPKPVGADPATLEIMRQPTGQITVLGLQEFSGVRARLISCLLDVFDTDRAAGLRYRDYHSLKAREIADCLGVSEEYVRTEVKRIRQQLRVSWTAIYDTPAPTQILIRTVGKRGYRLDSALNVVSPEKAD